MIDSIKLVVNVFISRFFRVTSIVLMILAVLQLIALDCSGAAFSLAFAFFAVYMELDPLNKNEVVDSDD